MTPPPLLFYLHLYKTAGSSVRELLHTLAGDDEFLDVVLQERRASDGLPLGFGADDPIVKEVVAVLGEAVEGLAYVALDLPYGVHEVVRRPVRYAVAIREPVDRLLSYVRFARKQGPGTIWPALVDVDFDFELAVDRHGLFAFANDQVRMITGSRAVDLTDDDLEHAKHLLATRYAAVGTFDRLDDFGVALAHLLGRPAGRLPHLNTTEPGRSDFLGEARVQQIRDMNELDRRLVRWWSVERSPA